MKKMILGVILPLLAFSACTSEDLDKNPKTEDKVETSKGSVGELVTLKSGVVVEKKDDVYIYQGDILLSEAQLTSLDETGSIVGSLTKEDMDKTRDTGVPVDPFTGLLYYNEPGMSKSVGQNPSQYRYWTVLRYKFNPYLSKGQVQAIRSAIAHIESQTNVRFYNATNQPNYDYTYGFEYPYVEFTPAYVNNSYVGQVGGKQILNLYNFDRGTIVHEICHALGMFHEQCRPDRDQYLNVYYSNIPVNQRHNFDLESANSLRSQYFDFNSIMLYEPYSFALDPRYPTMTKKDGTLYQVNNTGLSELDRQFLNATYYPFVQSDGKCTKLDKIVYGSDNKPLSEKARLTLESKLNEGRCNAKPKKEQKTNYRYKYLY